MEAEAPDEMLDQATDELIKQQPVQLRETIFYISIALNWNTKDFPSQCQPKQNCG